MKIPRRARSSVFCFPMLAVALGTTSLPAQTIWTVENLHPAGAIASYLRGTTGTQQVGYAIVIGGSNHAALWAGSAASFTDVNIGQSSRLFAVGGGIQAGELTLGGNTQGAVRNGTTGGFSLLAAPGNSVPSRAYATTGKQHVGSSFISADNAYHATRWNEFRIATDIHPPGATYSEAFATSGTQQAGVVRVGGQDRAALWSGSSSYWNLNPPGAFGSAAYALAGSRQFGQATIGGAVRAAMWSGSASSFEDLSPAGATASAIYAATTTGWQAGYATIGGNRHAGAWAGTAGSFVDLHSVLGAGYSTSEARGVWSDGRNVLVAGSAYNPATLRNEAILWRGNPAPPPVVTAKGKMKITTTQTRRTIRGTARAVAGSTVAAVNVKVGKAKAKTAKGTVSWSYRAKLRPGTNKITVTAVSGVGLASAPVRLRIIRR